MYGRFGFPPIMKVLLVKRAGLDVLEDPMFGGPYSPALQELIKLAQEDTPLPPEAEASIAHQQLAEEAQYNQQAAVQAVGQLQQLQVQMQQMQQQYEQQLQQLQAQNEQLRQQVEALAQQLQQSRDNELQMQNEIMLMRKMFNDYRQQISEIASVDPTAQATAEAAQEAQAATAQQIPPQALPKDVAKEVEQAQKAEQHAAVQEAQAQQKVEETGLKAAALRMFGDDSPTSILKAAVLLAKKR